MCVCRCVGACGKPKDNMCVCVCVNEGECCGLSQPVICGLLSNELTVQKKKEQSAGRGIGGRLANQNTNQSLIELSCRVPSPRPSVLESDPVWLKRGQMGHHNQLSAFGSVCLFAKPNGDYHSLWSIKKRKNNNKR